MTNVIIVTTRYTRDTPGNVESAAEQYHVEREAVTYWALGRMFAVVTLYKK